MPHLSSSSMPASRLPLLALLLSLYIPSTASQSIGSFFTAIQYNNGALPAGSSACDNMGGSASGYCCNNGHSCAWDDSGSVACCAQGNTCSGAAGGGAWASGAKYNDQSQYNGGGQYQQSQWNGGAVAGGGGGCNTCQNVCNTCQQAAVATTVYVAQTTYPQQTSYVQTSYYQQSSYVASSEPTVVTVPPVVGGGVRVTTTLPVNQACGGGGYTTLTQANVGMPVRTVGCFVIFDAGAGRAKEVGLMGLGVGVAGWVVWWVV